MNDRSSTSPTASTPPVSTRPSARFLGGLAARTGELIVAPRVALRRIDDASAAGTRAATEPSGAGGLNDAIALAMISVVAFRLPELVQTLWGFAGATSATSVLARLAGLFADAAKEAAWFVLPAAVVITMLAGARRDAGRDLDLGATAYVPFFFASGAARTLALVTGRESWYRSAAVAAGVLGAAWLVREAVIVARCRPAREQPTDRPTSAAGPANATTTAAADTANTTDRTDSGPRPFRMSGEGVGRGAVGLTVAMFLCGALWTLRHGQALRPIRSGEEAPTFALPRLDGPSGAAALGLADLRGKVVLLDFWASWCGPCLAMMPTLHEMHREWSPRGVAFLGINSDGGGATADDVKAFLIEHPMPYPNVIDQDGYVGGLYKVQALPSLVVIGRDGHIKATFVGMVSQGTLERALGETIAAADQP